MISRRKMLLAGLIPLAGPACLLGKGAAVAGTKPRFEMDPRRRWVLRLAGLVLPATDTPGADADTTAEFVFLALDRRMSDLNPQMLEQVTSALDELAGGSFLRQPKRRQQRLLADFDHRCYSGQSMTRDTAHAWRRLKAAIAGGYYTSRVGATQELIYDPVPGEFKWIKLIPSTRGTSNEGFNGGFGGAL